MDNDESKDRIGLAEEVSFELIESADGTERHVAELRDLRGEVTKYELTRVDVVSFEITDRSGRFPSGVLRYEAGGELKEVEVTGPPAVDLARDYGAPPGGGGGDGQP